MIASMGIFETIHREIRDVRATGYQQVVHIRITADAIPGSVVTTPLTPERLRLLAQRGVWSPAEETVVIADPEAQERWVEIVMHPVDWYALLADVEAIPYIDTVSSPGKRRVFGIAVSEP